jgi:protein Mpv17
LAIEIHEVDRRISEEELIPDSKLLPPPFDFERYDKTRARYKGWKVLTSRAD